MYEQSDDIQFANQELLIYPEVPQVASHVAQVTKLITHVIT